MTVLRETREHTPKPHYISVVVSATCDCCGADCWYPAHNQPVAVLSRVQDDGKGNMDIWDLDLCEDCKNIVMARLRGRSLAFGRELPNHREEVSAS